MATPAAPERDFGLPPDTLEVLEAVQTNYDAAVAGIGLPIEVTREQAIHAALTNELRRQDAEADAAQEGE